MRTLERVPHEIDAFESFAANINQPIIIFGADIAGKIVKKIIEKRGLKVKAFADNNSNKITAELDGVPVIHASELFLNYDPRSIILIASTYISDIIRQLEDRGFYNWCPIVNILDLVESNQQDKMLQGDLRKNHSGGEFSNDFDTFVLENMKNSQRKYLDKTILFIRSVDIMITERCSLKCKDCSNLMQYYEKPNNIETLQIKKEIDAVSDVADEINELRIIGGDALMNKSFAEITNYASAKENVNKVVVYTNGTIAPRREKILEIERKDKVFFFITTYGDKSRHAEELASILKENGIRFNKQPAYGWTDCGRIVKHTRSVEQTKQIFQNCCAKHFTTLTDDKLFRCPFAANLHRLKAASLSKTDFVDIGEQMTAVGDRRAAVRDAVSYYLRDIAYLDACNYCNGRTYGDPEIEPGIQTLKPIPYEKNGA